MNYKQTTHVIAQTNGSLPQPTEYSPATDNQPAQSPPVQPESGGAQGRSPAGSQLAMAREALLHYERIIEQSLANEAQRDLALLRIHDSKLYKVTHASFAEYLQERWGFSRSRGYQMLHHARVKLACIQNGQPPPANERQARELGKDGMSLKKQSKESSYEKRFQRVTKYLAKNLAESFAAEPLRFLEDLRTALHDFEQKLGRGPLTQNQTSAWTQTQAATYPTASTAGGPGSFNPGARPLLVPCGNSGSYVGMSIEEARKRGYV